MNHLANLISGMTILQKKDPNADVGANDGSGDGTIQVTLGDGINFSDEEADELKTLGWYWEDRDCWIYSFSPVEDSES